MPAKRANTHQPPGPQTTNLARAHRMADRLQAGIVLINDWAMLDPAVPFGG